jgi:uncharacterized protein YegL
MSETEAAEAEVLPMYFVPDQSGSMEPWIGELNSGLKSLHDELNLDPMAAAAIRFSIIGFSDAVYEHLRLADLRYIEAMPTLATYNQTSYVAIFHDLRKRIDTDVRDLRSANLIVLRPVVVFLTDGVPNPSSQPWEEALTHLQSESFKYRPNILTFGIGNAVPSVILRVATDKQRAYVAAKGIDTGAVVANFCKEFARFTRVTGRNVASGNADIPNQKPAGFTLALDVLPD